MKKILVLLTILTSWIGISQEKDIEIISSKTDYGILVNAQNNSDIQQEVTLELNLKGLRAEKNPVTKLVPANSTIEMVKLYSSKGKGYKYSSRFSYKPKRTTQEQLDYSKKLEEMVSSQVGDLEKGVIVFSWGHCSAMEYTTNYLVDNDIDFRILKTNENQDHNKLMWDLVKKEGHTGNKLTVPVIMVDGKISYNIPDLKKFLGGLAQNDVVGPSKGQTKE